MFKSINIGANALKFAIAIAGCALAIWAAFKWDAKLENKDDITPFVSAAVWICTIVGLVAAALAVIFGLVKFFTHLKKNKAQLIGILVFAGILAIAWFGLAHWGLAEYFDHRGEKFIEANEGSLTQGLVTLSDGGGWAVFILIPLAFVLTVVAEVVNIFK